MPRRRMRSRLLAVPAMLAAMCVLPVAAADAHGFGHRGPFHSGHGWGQRSGWGHHGWSPTVEGVAPPPKYGFYGFVGTVTATSSDSVSVSVTTSEPSALFSGADAFAIGPRTVVLGGSASAPFGSISGVSVGDVVAGGLISQAGQTAAAIETDPLEFLIDFPASAAPTNSTGTTTSTAAIRHQQTRAKALLFAERKRLAKSAAKKSPERVGHGK